MIKNSEHKWLHPVGGIVFLYLTYMLYKSLYHLGSELHQGDVYRILFIHVPSAFSCFFCAFVLFLVSIWNLKKQSVLGTYLAKACAEVGLLLTALTLITGSIWGKPTWGVWWTWDARVTTTFILALMFGGYLLLYTSLQDPQLRQKVCAVLGILIFVDVPIIYKSVTWWRTLHQPPSLFRAEGSTMAPEFRFHLYECVIVILLAVCFLIYRRSLNLKKEHFVHEMAHEQV